MSSSDDNEEEEKDSDYSPSSNVTAEINSDGLGNNDDNGLEKEEYSDYNPSNRMTAGLANNAPYIWQKCRFVTWSDTRPTMITTIADFGRSHIWPFVQAKGS